MFEIGDRVRIKSPKSEYDGTAGEIVGVDERGTAYTLLVRIDGWIGPGIPFDDTELIAPESTPLRRVGERVWSGLIRHYARMRDYDG